MTNPPMPGRCPTEVQISPDQQPALVARDDAVVTITLNRPDRLNAMNEKLLADFLLAVEEATSDSSVRILMLTGAGRGFCAGGDLAGFSKGDLVEPVPLATQVRTLRTQMRVVNLLREAAPITIAAVNGPCAGAGLSLALACDIRVGSDSAVFRTAFIDAGLSGDFGGTWLLGKLIGEARAKQLYLLSDRIDAQTALDFGLLSRIFPEADFAAEAARLAQQLAGKAPIALAAIKRNFLDAATMDFSSACDREAERHIACARTADALEAATAFVEKRSPRFVGA